MSLVSYQGTMYGVKIYSDSEARVAHLLPKLTPWMRDQLERGVPIHVPRVEGLEVSTGSTPLQPNIAYDTISPELYKRYMAYSTNYRQGDIYAVDGASGYTYITTGASTTAPYNYQAAQIDPRTLRNQMEELYYRIEKQNREVHELRAEKKEKEVKKKNDLKGLIAYYYNRK